MSTQPVFQQLLVLMVVVWTVAVFSVLFLTAFLLNLLTPVGLRVITPRLRREDGLSE